MVEGDSVELSFFDSKYQFNFLGGGQSVFAFTKPDTPGTVWLIVPEHRFLDGSVQEDFSKDVLCEAWISSGGNPYLPEIRYVGADIVFGHDEINGRYSKVYGMKYYRDLTREDKEQWEVMKQLHKVRSDGKNTMYEIQRGMGGPEPSLTFLGNKAAKQSLLMSSKLDGTLVNALKSIYDAIITKNRDGLTFEFNLRNVAVGEDGHLILRDPVYDSDITVRLKEDRRKQS